MKYTDEQEKIIKSTADQLRIIAGPGCGKSTVVVGRIVELINRGVSPENIFVFCFAKHDKANLINKLKNFLDWETINKLVVNNYHGFGLSIIRQYGLYGKEGKEIKLLEENESYTFIRQELEYIYSQCAASQKEADILFKKAKRAGLVDLIFEGLNSIRDEYCLDLINANKILSEAKYHTLHESLIKQIEGFNKQAEKVATADDYNLTQDYTLFTIKEFIYIAEKYGKFCKTHGYVDFMDMILQAYNIIKNNSKILEIMRTRAEHVLVDEFQDISSLQFEFVTALTTKHNRIFCVGDVDQCVYEWRNAKPFYMKDELPKRFKKLVSLPLSINFRSDAHVINAANKLIINNVDRLNFVLQAHFPAKEPIKFKKTPTMMDQASEIAILVERLLGSSMNYYTDKEHKIAIIVRSARSVSANLIRNALFKKKIPVQLRFESKIVEKVMSLICSICNLIVDPTSPADISSIISILPGFGEKTLDKFRSELTEGSSLLDAATKIKIKGERLALIQALNTYILDLHKSFIKNEDIKISELNLFNRSFDLTKILRNNFTQGKGVLENTSLIDTTIDEIKNNGERFLDYRDTLTSGLSALNHVEEGKKPSVLLCTSHHAKGGEWDIVICPDLVNGNGGFPVSRDDENNEEERRICYVAITRAKRLLYIFSYAEDMKREFVGLSPFVKEMGILTSGQVLGSSASNLYSNKNKNNFIVRKKKPY